MRVLWKHKKGGLYEIVGFVVIEKGLVPAVAYRSLDHDGPTFIRPANEFFDGRFRQAVEWDEEEDDAGKSDRASGGEASGEGGILRQEGGVAGPQERA